MPQTYNHEIQSLVRLAGNVTDAFTAALFLVDETKRDRLVLEAFQSLSNNIIPGATIPIGHGLVGWVAKHERHTYAKNFRHDTTTLQFYSKDEDIKSFAATPIFDQDRLLGVLAVDSKQQYVFTEKQTKLLSEFGEAFARVITQGKKRIRLHNEAVNINALSEIAEMASGCETVSELTRMIRIHGPSLIPHDYLVFAIRSFGDKEFHLLQSSEDGSGQVKETPLPLTHYRLGWVIHQARAIYLPVLEAPVIPGDNKKWGSFIGAPMFANNLVTGAIGLMSRKPEAFRQVDLKSLSILSVICASTFTSLYLLNKSENARLSDPLTETVAYRALLKKHKGMERNGAIALIDLKNFGRVNQELGLDGGDSVLLEMAQRLTRVVNNRGEVSRFCGDKFILAFPGLTRRQIASTLKEVLESIDSFPFHYNGIEIYITPVAGVAVCPEDGHGAEELLLKAQHAAEQAKLASGACVQFYGDPDQRGQVHLQTLK